MAVSTLGGRSMNWQPARCVRRPFFSVISNVVQTLSPTGELAQSGQGDAATVINIPRFQTTHLRIGQHANATNTDINHHRLHQPGTGIDQST
jgi:hypothetical protein